MSACKGSDLMSEPDERADRPSVDRQSVRLSRRRLVTSSGVALATTGIASIGAATTHAFQATPAAVGTPEAAAEANDQTMGAGSSVQFFNLHEAATVDALVSRILPG